MVKHAYCLKKKQKIDDRKAVDYCLSIGIGKAICKNFTLEEVSVKGVRNIIQLKPLKS